MAYYNGQPSKWPDMNLVVATVKSMTVPKITNLMKAMNLWFTPLSLRTIGKKGDLVERVEEYIRRIERDPDVDTATGKYNKIKEMINSLNSNIPIDPPPRPVSAAAPPTAPIAGAPYYNPPRPAPQQSAAGPSSQPSWRAPIPKGASSYNGSAAKKPAGPVWRNSPLFEVLASASDMTMVPESSSAQDRKSATMSINIPDTFRQKLLDTRSNKDLPLRISVRMFCTSATFYPPPAYASAAGSGLPIEYPPTCEVRVNNILLAANLKGMKKKPGSTPPAEMENGKQGERNVLKLERGYSNKAELVHVNAGGEQYKKKYYMQACVIKSITPEEAVAQVSKAQVRPKEHIIEQLKKDASDGDIQIGPAALNLKCPLSYVRMSVPIRSTKCEHIQCFDALSWFSMNEQTPQWECPVCSRPIAMAEIFVDEYSQSIVQACPDSVDEVIVEPNGEWHTSNNKFFSSGWLPPPSVPTSKAGTPMSGAGGASPTVSISSNINNTIPTEVKTNAKEVFTLDSDDDDDNNANGSKSRLLASVASSSSLPPSSRAGSSSAAPQPRPPQPVASNAVIDLTSDSDDDMTARAPPPARSTSYSNGGAPKLISASEKFKLGLVGTSSSREESPEAISVRNKRRADDMSPVDSGRGFSKVGRVDNEGSGAASNGFASNSFNPPAGPAAMYRASPAHQQSYQPYGGSTGTASTALSWANRPRPTAPVPTQQQQPPPPQQPPAAAARPLPHAQADLAARQAQREREQLTALLGSQQYRYGSS